MNRKIIIWFKPVLFLIGLAFLFSLIQPLFTVSDYRIYQTVKGFYKEKTESLDAIYVGASNVYASWQGPAAWDEFGIACYGMSIPSMPATATKYLIEECRKTQPNALFIVNLNNFKSNGIVATESDIHNVTNFLPMSKTKIKLINELAKQVGYTGMDKAEFFLPIIRFHSGWNEFTSKTFEKELEGMKGASFYGTFLRKATNIKNEFRYTDRRCTITEGQDQILRDLVKYCQDEQVKMLFVFAPQAIEEDTSIQQINTMKDYVVAQGFPVLDMMEKIDELEFDFTSDFYDTFHCNIHGSLKFTHYLGAYLKENYGFSDKRGQSAYADWDRVAEQYMADIQPYTLNIERDNLLRDNTIEKTKVTKCQAYGQSIQIAWTKVPKATGYAVYRQHIDTATGKLTPWELMTNVSANTLQYIDNNLTRNITYRYTVVPFYSKGGEMVYGNFKINGVSAKSALSAPNLLKLEESDSGITISWKAMKDAKGYVVYRKTGTENWIKLKKLKGNVTTFTDKYYQSDLPYIYTVKAYEMVDGAQQNGDHDRTGLLRYVELPKPEPVVMLTDNGVKINWNKIEGANSYSVYVKDADDQWSAVATHITDIACLDKNYVEGTSPVYKVVAEIIHGKKYYEFPSEQVILAKGDN